ncbi:MAG TPA: hypothetical protein VJU53_14300, partial [Burkholderiaceae bacterium]|nr:hypothetical protein [Burkholderiaceae bacterium]
MSADLVRHGRSVTPAAVTLMVDVVICTCTDDGTTAHTHSPQLNGSPTTVTAVVQAMIDALCC